MARPAFLNLRLRGLLPPAARSFVLLPERLPAEHAAFPVRGTARGRAAWHFGRLALDALGLSRITFVVHDWRATLGFDYANRHPGRVARIAFMEGVLPPIFPQPSFEAMGEEMGGMFRALRDPQTGLGPW